MKNFQSILINRLAHQVKNDLTTMRLALFNLNDLLQASGPDSPQLKEKSTEFLKVIGGSLDRSVATLSKILLATRTDEKYFKQLNLIRILFDLITRHADHGKFKIEIFNKELLISTDEQALMLFLELLLQKLTASLKNNEDSIRIQLDESVNTCLVFTGTFLMSELSTFLGLNHSSSEEERSVAPLLVRQIGAYLKIAWELEQQKNEYSKLRIMFNQEFRNLP